MKIKVVVRGGVIQQVFADSVDVEVDVLDYDNLYESEDYPEFDRLTGELGDRGFSEVEL